jgi:hypothetical protein
MSKRSLISVSLALGQCQNESPTKSAKFNVNYCNTKNGKLELLLSCDTNYVLLDVSVLAGAGGCCKECEDVYGKTIDMLPADNKCYWKPNCTIKLPKDIMIVCYNIITNNNNKRAVVSSEREQCDCTLIKPQFLRPIHAKCIKTQGNPRKLVWSISLERNEHSKALFSTLAGF